MLTLETIARKSGTWGYDHVIRENSPKEIRKAFGITQQDLADTLHVSRRLVNQYENGKLNCLYLQHAYSCLETILTDCREGFEEDPVLELLDIIRDKQRLFSIQKCWNAIYKDKKENPDKYPGLPWETEERRGHNEEN